ncbi:unnamed protein product [Auanema sp. JU1783]|nr:unnamed protein product [Auanema sp. JU1783]
MSVFQPLTLSQIRRDPESHRQIRVYADGAYDLFHYGHMEQLKQAKTAFKNIYLIVGVVTDADCLQFKSGPTVMTHEERVKSVECCTFVDEVIAYPPFYPTIAFANKHEIDLVAHDSIPYEINNTVSTIDDCYEPFKRADRFLETIRTPVISTTELVERIISRADEYRLRNIKRGVLSMKDVEAIIG